MATPVKLEEVGDASTASGTVSTALKYEQTDIEVKAYSFSRSCDLIKHEPSHMGENIHDSSRPSSSFNPF